jgi:NAD-dependent DNA ligase
MIEELRKKIIEANESYRKGNAIISDYEYDQLMDELSILSPDDELLAKVGYEISDETRKSRLPIPMFSMNKIKLIEDIHNWFRLKEIPENEDLIITPKFDGLSFCVKEDNGDSWTRGDGIYGQKSNKHYSLIQNHLNLKDNPFVYTYGEIMIPKQTFIEKYSDDFANPRNLVAGLLNSKEPSEFLKDCQYIKYGAISDDNFKTKKELLDKLNIGQSVKVQYHMCKLSDLNEDLLFQLFQEYSKEYEIDGLILEVNNIELQEKLGRETSSNNPCFSRAYKSSLFEQKSETEVLGITWNISKQGYLKPVLNIKPIRLDGVTISNVTGNNARFIKDLGIGVGSKIIIKRSGMVIPVVVEVLNRVEFQMPYLEDSNGKIDYNWNENGVELVTLRETDFQKIKKIISFFQILETDNVSEGVINQLYEAGYKTIKDILNLKKSDLEKIDRFGKRKSQIVYDSIQKSIKNVQLSKLQHATGIFQGLGQLKLVKLEHFITKPSIEQVMEIEGFAEITATTYVESYDDFFEFIKDLPITIFKKEDVKTSNELEGMSIIFTGFRDKGAESIILSKGGKISNSVSKNTTHLVCVDKNSTSSKMIKAIDLGIMILDRNELQQFINN